MEKITGNENRKEIPPKVLQMYGAVMELMAEGTEFADMKVSTITDKAGIGKGTAYEYFESKDDIVACAVVHHMNQVFQRISGELQKRQTFEEQIKFLLDEVEKTKEQKVCFFRFAHLLTDQSDFSMIIRRKMNSTEFAPTLPVHFLRRMTQEALRKGELQTNASLDYITCFLMAQLMNYTLYFAMEGDMILAVSPEEMRQSISRSIRSELKML